MLKSEIYTPMGHEPSNTVYDYSAFSHHMTTIIAQGLTPFPELVEEVREMTPHEQQIPPSQAVAPLTSTPMTKWGPPKVVRGYRTALGHIRSSLAIPYREFQSHSLGHLTDICQFCNALYFTEETCRNLCCKKGQVLLPPVK